MATVGMNAPMNANFNSSRGDGLAEERSESVDDHIPIEEVELAGKENRAVKTLRLILVTVLISTALAVSSSVYFYSREQELSSFKSGFSEHAGKIIDSFQANAERRLAALQAFSQQITSHAVSTGETFPNVTLPDFERNAGYTLRLADVVALLVFPMVTKEQRRGWEKYSVEHQSWLTEGLNLQLAERAAHGDKMPDDDSESIQVLKDKFVGEGIADNQTEKEIIDSLKITPIIFKVNPGTSQAALELGPGPYFPIWQLAPAIPASALINFNSLSHPARVRELTTMMKTEGLLISSAADFKDDDPSTANRKAVMNLFLNRWMDGELDYEDGPVSDIYLPIFNHNGENKTMAAVLTAYVYWQGYFTNIVPENARGIICVLENSCNQTFTYELNGKHASYIGKGDLHNKAYNHLKEETDFGAFVKLGDVANALDGQCHYKVTVYPSEVTAEGYISMTPVSFTLVLVFVFIFTSLVFVVYDYLVHQRHKVVNTTAVQSAKVVSSLFPEQVRDRLYQSADSKKKESKNILNKGIKALMSGDHIDGEIEIDDSIPIADLYPNCTVFFADIAGFTAWSSERQPTEVFKLLESLYGAFDAVATKRKVFKIETIGDCYLAVTGLPNPQEDHAVRMALFAGDCFIKMNQVLHRLVDKLGEDTSTLTMRAGLHSGPVTAGVLRGAKARFQLFGDTVNTASRMESTGERGRIHVSDVTAKILCESGYGAWVTKRDDLVTAKGKGTMQTYWIQPMVNAATSIADDATEQAEMEEKLVSYLSRSEKWKREELVNDFVGEIQTRIEL